MRRPSATPTVHVDDGRVRITEWQFTPGAETGWHIHEHDYAVIPIMDGSLILEEPGNQENRAELKRHQPYARRAGVEHNVINAGEGEMAFLELEIIDREKDSVRLACLSRFMDAWNARDVDALMDCMAEDCVFVASGGPDADGRTHVGREVVSRAYAALFDTFPEAAWTNGRHIVFGDRGLSEWRFVGRTRDGSTVEVDGCDIFEFDGDRIRVKNSFRKIRS